MKITLEGYTPPENTAPGESFEAVATLKVNEDGSFELTAIDGMKLEGEPEAPAEEMNELQKLATKVPLPWNEQPEY